MSSFLLRLPAHPGVVVLGVRRLRVAGLERMSRARQGIDCASAGSGRATTWVRLRSEGHEGCVGGCVLRDVCEGCVLGDVCLGRNRGTDVLRSLDGGA